MVSYLRMYIENVNGLVTTYSFHNFENCAPTFFFFFSATALDIKQLVTFWVGWTILQQHPYVEVSNSIKMPTAFTEKIKLPSHYTNYMDFKANVKAAVSTSERGFGLI